MKIYLLGNFKQLDQNLIKVHQHTLKQMILLWDFRKLLIHMVSQDIKKLILVYLLVLHFHFYLVLCSVILVMGIYFLINNIRFVLMMIGLYMTL